MKRTKQAEIMVQEINDYLRRNKAKEDDPVFIIFGRALSTAKIYQGYNLFTEDGKLSGWTKEVDHVQFY